jgi:hypothetical protein
VNFTKQYTFSSKILDNINQDRITHQQVGFYLIEKLNFGQETMTKKNRSLKLDTEEILNTLSLQFTHYFLYES